MKKFTKLEKLVLSSACFRKKLRSALLPILFIISFILFRDILFSVALTILLFIYFHICYKYYTKYALETRDQLLDLLEKNGRKELSIPDSSKAIRLFKKSATCDLPDEPTNIKEFTLHIIFLGTEHLTIYTKCPKSLLYAVEKKTTPPKDKGKIKDSCGENREYYYYDIMGVHYDASGKKVCITLHNAEKIELTSEKAPAKKAVNAIREMLRVAYKDVVRRASQRED